MIARRTPSNMRSRKQRGSTLLVGLVMLVLMTLMAVSAINSTTSGIQVVGNTQFRQEANAAAQAAIERVISNTNFTVTPPAQDTTSSNYTVTFDAPICLSAKATTSGDLPILPLACIGSASIGTLCYWTTWDITARVNDGKTGASTVIHQGARVLAGQNAAVVSCGV